jgi:hypothetical protein
LGAGCGGRRKGAPKRGPFHCSTRPCPPNHTALELLCPALPCPPMPCPPLPRPSARLTERHPQAPSPDPPTRRLVSHTCVMRYGPSVRLTARSAAVMSPPAALNSASRVARRCVEYSHDTPCVATGRREEREGEACARECSRWAVCRQLAGTQEDPYTSRGGHADLRTHAHAGTRHPCRPPGANALTRFQRVRQLWPLAAQLAHSRQAEGARRGAVRDQEGGGEERVGLGGLGGSGRRSVRPVWESRHARRKPVLGCMCERVRHPLRRRQPWRVP